MFIEERHREILNTIKEQGRILISEIQEKYQISVDSARRDLRILEQKGLLKRTHGGAIPIMQVGIKPPRQRDPLNMQIKQNYDLIAKRAAQFIQPNDIVYLTSGSVGFLMLKYLPKDIPYTLVVNSVTLAEQLKYWDNIEVFIVGGKMRMHGTSSLVDSFATEFINKLHFDISFLTGAGFDAEFGMSNGTSETATFQSAVIKQTRNNILLMPNEKIGFKGFIKVCNADCFDTLITDWDAPEDELLKIEELGINIIVVEQE